MSLRKTILPVYLVLIGTVSAGTYEDALSAFNSGHYSVASQLVERMDPEDPKGQELTAAIEEAVAQARVQPEQELSVAELEQGGPVIRSLDDPQMMGQLLEQVDMASEQQIFRAAQTETQSGEGTAAAGGAELTVDQEVARLQAKMADEAVGSSVSGRLTATGLDVGSDKAETIRLRECLTDEQIKKSFSQARSQAAAFAMDKARAIAQANEIRQQRAVARARVEIAAELTHKIRQQLDARFQQEVDARVAAVVAGQKQQQLVDEHLQERELTSEHLAQLEPGRAEYRLARYLLDNGGRTEDRAVAWLILAAEKGYPQAQYELGSLYFRGVGVDLDYGKAEQWWLDATEAGQADAGAALAMLKQRWVRAEYASISPAR